MWIKKFIRLVSILEMKSEEKADQTQKTRAWGETC